MQEDNSYTLVPSNNPGRFALRDGSGDFPDQDVTTGVLIEIYLDNRWIPGRVEYMDRAYPMNVSAGSINPVGLQPGYYFEAAKGGTCGLCIGMHVKVL